MNPSGISMLKKYNANLNRSLLVQVLRLLLIAKNATVSNNASNNATHFSS
ncbi:hypothetical protein [Shewanella sp. T24-MNA-CIBAN-0130]